MKSHCGAITWLNLRPLQTGQWDGNKRSARDQLQSQLIPITPVEINREGSEWRRWESDESAPPQPPPTLLAPPLLSANGAEEEGVTKARVWSVIRKGQMSHIGSGPSPRSVCACGHPAVSGAQPGKPPRWRCPLSLVWMWLCAFRYTECWCVFLSAVKDGRGGREGADRDRGSGEVQGEIFFFFFFCREPRSAGKPNCFRILVSTPLPTLPVS